ncbi:MAG: aminotransferase class V-fold PLP-dependent enzyme [Candidatus Koribacter versatilis]|uniref:Aminotransferase class V-fold PLP-dependent enzyme n=1 Tax=Candidatus Korobacter versatilis TaxID=658062 RepID=A0A932EPY1_9BACT|nr:aminotransferase class V-fold PLP-dependent enzyme [Candidatus Koribacter versatilis]
MGRLSVSDEEFRALAARTSELAADYLAHLDDVPAFPETSGERTLKLFATGLPEEGMGASAFDGLGQIVQHVRPSSPRFFGYVFGSGEPVAALGDYFASVLNQNVTAWRSGPAAVTIERAVVRGLAEAIGCRGFTGSLCGGGSSANLMGLAMARESKAPANEAGARPGTVYASREVHMSIPKAMALLGLGRSNLRLVEVDDSFRMRADKLREAVEQDKRADNRLLAVVATAGTVNTGAIDPLPEIAAVAREHRLWFHVDGAYGALAALAIPEKFTGLSEADSLSLDAHKWLYQPVDCGCLLYRDTGAAQRAFSHTGDYAKSLTQDPVEGFVFFEESMELSRRFRALKVWLSLRYHGLAAFRDSIAEDLRLAQYLVDRIRSEEQLELLASGELSAVCFRARGASDANNAEILKRVVQRGRVYLSNATICGMFALRACVVNHRTTEKDMDLVIEEVLAVAKGV